MTANEKLKLITSNMPTVESDKAHEYAITRFPMETISPSLILVDKLPEVGKPNVIYLTSATESGKVVIRGYEWNDQWVSLGVLDDYDPLYQKLGCDADGDTAVVTPPGTPLRIGGEWPLGNELARPRIV